MRDTHRDMRVTNGEFDALIQALEGAPDEFNVPKAVRCPTVPGQGIQ